MKSFEGTENFYDGTDDVDSELDNLGNNPKFIPLDDVAVDSALSPDEFLIQKEKEIEEEGNPREVVDSEDLDTEPSNWEKDFDSGKYDEVENKSTSNIVDINPVLNTTRGNITSIEEKKRSERQSRYWDHPGMQKTDNAKPRRDQDNRESIRDTRDSA